MGPLLIVAESLKPLDDARILCLYQIRALLGIRVVRMLLGSLDAVNVVLPIGNIP